MDIHLHMIHVTTVVGDGIKANVESGTANLNTNAVIAELTTPFIVAINEKTEMGEAVLQRTVIIPLIHERLSPHQEWIPTNIKIAGTKIINYYFFCR